MSPVTLNIESSPQHIKSRASKVYMHSTTVSRIGKPRKTDESEDMFAATMPLSVIKTYQAQVDSPRLGPADPKDQLAVGVRRIYSP
jgi:hypothetical protein